MARFRKLGGAIVLSTMVAIGMTTAFSAPLQASGGTVPTGGICDALKQAADAVNASSLPAALKAAALRYIGIAQARYGCL